MGAQGMKAMDILVIADSVGIRLNGEELHRLLRRQVRDGLNASDIERILRQFGEDARDHSRPAHRDPTASKAVGNVGKAR